MVIDTFEQPVQRPKPKSREEADKWYSGKKKRHTVKSQLGVDRNSGEIVDVGESVPGPTNDLSLLKQTKLLDRLPEGVSGEGDLAYVGIATLHPQKLGFTPRRKPRGADKHRPRGQDKERPPEDIAYNTAFAKSRIVVEHGAYYTSDEALPGLVANRPASSQGPHRASSGCSWVGEPSNQTSLALSGQLTNWLG